MSILVFDPRRDLKAPRYWAPITVFGSELWGLPDDWRIAVAVKSEYFELVPAHTKSPG
jgi:hypothetical protein